MESNCSTNLSVPVFESPTKGSISLLFFSMYRDCRGLCDICNARKSGSNMLEDDKVGKVNGMTATKG